MEVEDMVLLAVAARRAGDGSGRKIREDACIPQAVVAENIGVSEATICRWELGQRQPRGDAAIRWAKMLDRLERAHRRKERQTARP